MTCAAGNDGCFNKIEDSQHHRIPDISLKNDKRNLEVFWGQDSPPRNRSCWFLLVFDLVVSLFKRFASACWRRYQPLTSYLAVEWGWHGMTVWPLYSSTNGTSQTVQRFDFTMTKRPTTCLKVSRRCAQEEGRSSEREGANWQRVQGTEPRSPWSSRWGTLVKRHRVACISYTCSSWLGIIWYHQYHPVLSILSGWWFGQFFIFPYIGNNHPNWLSYFSEGLKPPTSYRLTRQLQYAASPSSVYFSNRGKKNVADMDYGWLWPVQKLVSRC